MGSRNSSPKLFANRGVTWWSIIREACTYFRPSYKVDIKFVLDGENINVIAIYTENDIYSFHCNSDKKNQLSKILHTLVHLHFLHHWQTEKSQGHVSHTLALSRLSNTVMIAGTLP
jgi:hypothetical protein